MVSVAAATATSAAALMEHRRCRSTLLAALAKLWRTTTGVCDARRHQQLRVVWEGLLRVVVDTGWDLI